MSIYRGAGGAGDAVADSSSEAVLTVQARDAAIAAQNAAEAAQVAAELAETNAETAATNAATSEANALTSENNAESSKDLAEAWATQLSTPVSGSSYSAKYNANLAAASAVTAGGYADDANSYKLSAASSASTATTQAGIASGHASSAATSESNAATSETNAATSESNAAASAASAAASYDNFDDRYLGPKSSNPTVDNDGNALLTGALYFNTVVPEMRVYNGSSWNFIGSGGGAGVESFNTRTGDVTLTSSDVTTALTYTPLAPSAIGSTVQAYDAQLADIAGLTPTDNSFIVGNGTNFVAEGASTARTSLGLGTAATTDATAYATAAQGTAADTAYADRLKWDGGSTGLVAATGRTSLGLGTAATTAATDYATAAQGTKADNALTAANPSYTGTLTGGTGVVNLGSGQVYKDASGNVGIGTTTPSYKLQIEATGTDHQLSVRNTGTTASDDAIILIGTNSTGTTATASGFYFGDADSSSIGQLLYRHSNNSLEFVTNNTTALTLSATGGVSLVRTAVTSPANSDGNLFSGTYTPSLVNTLNIASSTAGPCQYMRVGNVVTVSGQVTVDATTAGASTILRMSLPISSTLTTSAYCGGAGASVTSGAYGNSMAILGDTSANNAEFRWLPTLATAQIYNFTFTYQVV